MSDISPFCFLVFQGLEKTANKNFGGGNTAWEEEKLAKYARRLEKVLFQVTATLVSQRMIFMTHNWLDQQSVGRQYLVWQV